MNKSIDAYDNRARVTRYDADMDLMHPNRHKMVDVSLEILPFQASQPISVLDLGVGTGYFAMRLLNEYPHATLTGLDGSEAMIDLAKTRLSEFVDQGRVSFIQARFQDLDSAVPGNDRFDLAFSSYSLHHLDADEKHRAIDQTIRRLKHGGWFLNADLVSHRSSEIESAIQEARVSGIHHRNGGRDERFATLADIRIFLDGLEATEGDQPLTVEEDIEIFRSAGVTNASILWKEYREVVVGGCTLH